MGVKVTNNAFGTISAGINSTATTVTVDTGQGARFPTLGGSDHFYGTLIDTSNNIEVIKVTARSSDSMTVVRGQDNTSARAFSIGDRFELRPTAALFEDIQTEAVNAAEVVNDTTPQLGGVLDTNGNNIEFPDSSGAEVNRLKFGAGDDVSMYWDGTDGHITTLGTLNIDGADGHEMAKFVDGGAAELYHNDTKKFETTSTGTLNSGTLKDFRQNGSTNHRAVEFFDSAALSTSYANLFSVEVGTTHIGYYYEIIFYGGDWSGHSAARVIKRGFINGGNTYTGHSVVESSGPYASNMILNVTWSGNTSTVQLKLDTGAVTGTYYARLVGRMNTVTII